MNIQEINSLIQKEKGNINVKDVSDGHHTFGELYKNRIMLFCTLCNCNPDISWKSKKHYNEEIDPMFDGDFIAGINTPEGIATYHIKLEFWDLFHIPELDRAPQYDGYDNGTVLQRIYSLSKKHN